MLVSLGVVEVSTDWKVIGEVIDRETIVISHSRFFGGSLLIGQYFALGDTGAIVRIRRIYSRANELEKVVLFPIPSDIRERGYTVYSLLVKIGHPRLNFDNLTVEAKYLA